MKISKRKNRHSNKKTIIMMVLSLFLIFFINNCLNEIYETMDNMENRLIARKINMKFSQSVYDGVGKDIEEYLDTNENILAYSKANSSSVWVMGLEEEFKIQAVDTYIDDVMDDYMITDIKELQDDEIVIAKYITADDYVTPDKTMNYTDGEQYIGKSISCELWRCDGFTGEEKESIDYTFKVVGVFDNIKAGMNSDAFVSENVTHKMVMEKDMFSEDYMNTEEFYRYEPTVQMQVYVKEYGKINDNVQELYDICNAMPEDYTLIDPQVEINESAYFLLEGIRLIGNFIAIYLVICAVTNVYIHIKENLEKRRREFGILKAIGYSSIQISVTMLREALFCSFMSLGITYGIGGLAFTVINIYIKDNFNIFWNNIRFEMDFGINLIILGVGIVVPMYGYILSFLKIKKLEPMEALK